MKLVIFCFLLTINFGMVFSSDEWSLDKWDLDNAEFEDEVIVESQFEIKIPDNLTEDQVNFVTQKIRRYNYGELSYVVKANFNLLKSLEMIGNNREEPGLLSDPNEPCTCDLIINKILDAKKYDKAGESLLHHFMFLPDRVNVIETIFKVEQENHVLLLDMHPYDLKKNIITYDPTETIGSLLKQFYPDLYAKISQKINRKKLTQYYLAGNWTINIPENHKTIEEKIVFVTYEIKIFPYKELKAAIECNLELLKQLGMVEECGSWSTGANKYLIKLFQQGVFGWENYDVLHNSLLHELLLKDDYDLITDIFQHTPQSDHQRMLNMNPVDLKVKKDLYEGHVTIGSILQSKCKAVYNKITAPPRDICVNISNRVKDVANGFGRATSQSNEKLYKIEIPKEASHEDQLYALAEEIRRLGYKNLFDHVIPENFDLLKSLRVIDSNDKPSWDNYPLCIDKLLNQRVLDAKEYDQNGESLVHYFLTFKTKMYHDFIKTIFRIENNNIDFILNMAPRINSIVYESTETIGTLLQQVCPNLYKEIIAPPKDIRISPDGIYDYDPQKYLIFIPENIQSDKIKEHITQEISYFSYYNLQDVIECNIDLLRRYKLVGNYTETGKKLLSLHLIDLIKEEIIPLDKLDNSITPGINQKFLIEVLLDIKAKSVLKYIIENKQDKVMSVLDIWADPSDYSHTTTIALLLQRQYPDLYQIIAEEYEQHKQFVAQEAARKQREEEERSKLSVLKQRGYSPFQTIRLFAFFVLAFYLSYHLYQRMKPAH